MNPPVYCDRCKCVSLEYMSWRTKEHRVLLCDACCKVFVLELVGRGLLAPEVLIAFAAHRAVGKETVTS